MGESLSTQDYNWRLPRLAEEKLRPMPIEIEREPRPVTGINERSSTRLSFLSEELKGFQCS